MNDDQPQDPLAGLFASARRLQPNTSRVEYGFETRLIARLREERETSVLACAWRLCPFFAAIALSLTLWSRLAVSREQAERPPLLAVGAQPADEQEFVRYLTGARP